MSAVAGSICFAANPISPNGLRRRPASKLTDSSNLCFTSRERVCTSRSLLFPFSKPSQLECSASLGMNRPNSAFNESQPEPFWVTLSKDAIWGLRTLVTFLVEQPGQLKHIEWPSFQSTLKTATLTLVLVALLIVALTTVDSALCYLLTLLLRKSA